jgi:4-amino-4-deoxy-L-arabinose transferase-like glycosyltransferase
VNKSRNYLYEHPWFLVAGFLLLSVGFKTFLLATGRMPFNADEAVVGLMASHILEGELPVFFWGQSYMGSLDALLVAGAFLLIGKSILAIRIVQILLYCGVLATTYQLGYKIIGKVEAGWMAALLMAIPTVNVTLYTTISLGGYGEALLLGNLILLAGLRVIGRNTWPGWLFLGLLSGIGLWVNGLTLVYSIPVVLVSSWHLMRQPRYERGNPLPGRLLVLIGAGILGAIPWWIYGMQFGFNTLVTELLGSAISTPEVGYIAGLGYRLVSFLLFGLTVMFGLRPPWEIRWLVIPLIPLIITIWVLVLIGFRKLMKKGDGLGEAGLMLWGIILTLTAGFILTSFGNDPSGRYFLPLWIPLAIIAGGCLCLTTRLGHWRWGVLMLLVLFNLGGTAQCWLKNPPGFTTQFDTSTVFDQSYYDELITFLEDHSIDRGYTTYWVAYPLAFLSGEDLIFIPRLPYHSDFGYTDRDDRYVAYDNLVADSGDVSFITANQPWLDVYIRYELRILNIEWQESVIGNFNVFYDLSRRVTPDEIGLAKPSKSDVYEK